MKRTVSIITEGDTTEIQWGVREPVDGLIQGYVLIHPDGTLSVPFRDVADNPFVFVLDSKGGRIAASEDQPPDEIETVWAPEFDRSTTPQGGSPA